MKYFVCIFNSIGSNDYYPGPYNVTFHAGETIVLFNITITDDDMVEGNETFTLSIDTNALPSGVISISPYNVTAIIMDDDCKLPMKFYDKFID